MCFVEQILTNIYKFLRKTMELQAIAPPVRLCDKIYNFRPRPPILRLYYRLLSTSTFLHVSPFCGIFDTVSTTCNASAPIHLYLPICVFVYLHIQSLWM